MLPDDKRWVEFLSQVQHDRYHLPEYLEFTAKHESGEPLSFLRPVPHLGVLMFLDSSARRIAFWSIDALKGGVIKSHYNDIANIMKNGNANRGQLSLLLKHARETTPFYQEMSSVKKLSEIKDFPVVSKVDYKENYNAFQSNKFKTQRLHQMTTSGSTGIPFTVNQDMNKRKRVLAEIIYFNEIIGQNLGDKFIYFRVWTDKIKKSKIEQIKQNIIPFDTSSLDNRNLDGMRNLLKKKSVKSVITYASTYSHLINYMKENGDTPDMFNIKAFVSIAEVLDMYSKKLIKEIVGCDVIDRYSNSENGFIAQTEDLSDEFNVNRASYFVELLKLESNEVADEGELGRIVLTDLYNFAMPIIRNDTGDLAIKVGTKTGGADKFKSVQGRRVDVIYDTKGRKLTPVVLINHLWKFEKLKQYQFIQQDKNKYSYKVNGAEGVYTKDEFDKVLHDILGQDAEIDIQFVDTIPVLSSGKFKKIVCNYKPNN